jgi:hypothetical protein
MVMTHDVMRMANTGDWSSKLETIVNHAIAHKVLSFPCLSITILAQLIILFCWSGACSLLAIHHRKPLAISMAP